MDVVEALTRRIMRRAPGLSTIGAENLITEIAVDYFTRTLAWRRHSEVEPIDGLLVPELLDGTNAMPVAVIGVTTLEGRTIPKKEEAELGRIAPGWTERFDGGTVYGWYDTGASAQLVNRPRMEDRFVVLFALAPVTASDVPEELLRKHMTGLTHGCLAELGSERDQLLYFRELDNEKSRAATGGRAGVTRYGGI